MYNAHPYTAASGTMDNFLNFGISTNTPNHTVERYVCKAQRELQRETVTCVPIMDIQCVSSLFAHMDIRHTSAKQLMSLQSSLVSADSVRTNRGVSVCT